MEDIREVSRTMTKIIAKLPSNSEQVVQNPSLSYYYYQLNLSVTEPPILHYFIISLRLKFGITEPLFFNVLLSVKSDKVKSDQPSWG